MAYKCNILSWLSCLFIFIIFQIIPNNNNNVPALQLLLDFCTYFNSILSDSNIVSINLINSIVNNYFFSSLSDVIITEFTQIEVLGHSLYTYGAVLLIVLSVILLLAMYSTIIISRNNTNI